MSDTLEKGSFKTIAESILQKSSKTRTRDLSSMKSGLEDETFLVCTRRTASLDLLQEVQRQYLDLNEKGASERCILDYTLLLVDDLPEDRWATLLNLVHECLKCSTCE